MKNISLYIKVICYLLMGSTYVHGQTASATAGCAELKVEFSAPQADSYYWVFGDGTNSVSNLQNPEHSYIQPGDYVAQLFDQAGGTQVGGDIEITVYPPIEVDISADVREGCSPLEVNFISSINVHPDIEIQDVVWTFGDGNSASGANTTYTYTDNGVFTVSIKVITDESIKCDEPVIFEDYIRLEGAPVRFAINQTSSCDVPTDFVFTNTTNADPGSTFLWDFGNGQTRNTEGPHTISYSTAGLYFPSLTITSPDGCVTSTERSINLGAPVIAPAFPDTVCLGIETFLSQTTIAESFLWDFTGAHIDSTVFGNTTPEKRPLVLFTEPGLQTFTLSATAEDGCESIQTLSIFVFQPDASYTLGPDITCTDPILIEYSANVTDYLFYTFNNDINNGGVNVKRNSSMGGNIYEVPDRQEFYVNTLDSITTRLIVTSQQGCMDTVEQKFFLQKPEAFFLTDVVKGCIPFTVNFEDKSFSDFNITDRDWEFGDGNTASYGANDTMISHTYTTTGFHEVQLTIRDDSGCNDISRKVRILAIDKDTIPATGLPCPEEPVFCVGDEVALLLPSDQVINNLHLESDDGRFDHCWREREAIHTFQYPGEYNLDATWEFLTIYIDSLLGCPYIVEGSRSDIDYTIDCDTPFEVDLSSANSINADEFAWYIEDEMISTSPSLTYTFEARGEYMVYLDTKQDGVGCMHRDSVLLYITDVEARLNIDPESCASSPTFLDASDSQDVHNLCHAGYTWIFENQRPREVSSPILEHMLEPGLQRVTLAVEDINGCRDTISGLTTAFDLRSRFDTEPLICLPTELTFDNNSIGDTTIVSYNWDFGASNSSDENPTHIFTEEDYDPNLVSDSITVTLTVEDAIGCTDTETFLIETYDINSRITLDNGPAICQGESIGFTAANYTAGGSFLTYEWDFDMNGSSTLSDPTFEFNEAGDQLVTLTFTEDATGCQGVLDTTIFVSPKPVADFVTDQDSVEFICFPEQISFTNTSIIDTVSVYQWDFGNGAESDIENPVIPFDKGTYDVELIATTIQGCKDTTSASYTLVGPEGSFTIDKESICPGEDVTLTLVDAIDVQSYTWDFGDGVQVDNQSPVTHTYDPSNLADSIEVFNPTLILRSDGDGCELFLDIPIMVSSLGLEFGLQTGLCPGEVSFISEFVNPQSIVWDIDGQIVEGTSNPSVTIDSDTENIDVNLSIVDALGCVIEQTKNFDLPDTEGSNIEFPNVFSPNGDDLNPVFNIYFDSDALRSEVEVIEFRVYNRWGELLYNNDNPSVGWDGRYKGVVVPPDVYAYYIEVSIDGCSSTSRKGNVTVIK